MGGAIRTAGFPVFSYFTNGRDNNKQLFSGLSDNIQMSLSDVMSHFVIFLIFTDFSFKNKLLMAFAGKSLSDFKTINNFMDAPSIPSNHRTHSILLNTNRLYFLLRLSLFLDSFYHFIWTLDCFVF